MGALKIATLAKLAKAAKMNAEAAKLYAEAAAELESPEPEPEPLELAKPVLSEVDIARARRALKRAGARVT
jgi:hypothetical protein